MDNKKQIEKMRQRRLANQQKIKNKRRLFSFGNKKNKSSHVEVVETIKQPTKEEGLQYFDKFKQKVGETVIEQIKNDKTYEMDDKLKSDMEKELKDAKQEYDDEVKRYKNEYDSELKQLKEQYEKDVQIERNDLTFNIKHGDDDEIDDFKEEYNDNINELKEEYEDEVEQLNDDLKDNLESAKEEYEDEVERIRDEYEDEDNDPNMSTASDEALNINIGGLNIFSVAIGIFGFVLTLVVGILIFSQISNVTDIINTGEEDQQNIDIDIDFGTILGIAMFLPMIYIALKVLSIVFSSMRSI